MASRSRSSDTDRSRTTSWHKVKVDELADIIAGRTGMNEAEIRRVLQELNDTDIYVRPQGRTCGRGWFGKRNRKS